MDGGEINATVTLSEPKQSILLLDKNGLLLTADRRSRNDIGEREERRMIRRTGFWPIVRYKNFAGGAAPLYN